nr:heparinase II/III-family protein [Pseudomonadota bacterium]
LERSTVAHNTIAVENENSSEVWSSFRVAQRARVFDVQQNNNELSFSAAHDGYHRLNPKVTHTRKWVSGTKHITVEDQLIGQGVTSFTAFYHLQPDWLVEFQDPHILWLRSLATNSKVSLEFAEGSDIHITPYDYALGFNHKKTGWCISVACSRKNLPHTHIMTIGW